jgi:hypothetical protein
MRNQVSFELKDGRLFQRCGDSVSELGSVSAIQSWGFSGTDSEQVPIRFDSRAVVVLDKLGTLRRILEQVAGDRKLI